MLDKKDGKLLLTSKYALKELPYNNREEAVTWETCSLRKWLNGTFREWAFNEKEQDFIVTTNVKNEDNIAKEEHPIDGLYHTKGGNDTKDKIFLLSIKEAEAYFGSDSARKVSSAQNNMRYVNWWLRSPGGDSYYAALVEKSGGVNKTGDIGIDPVRGNGVAYNDVYVRPVLWLDPEP